MRWTAGLLLLVVCLVVPITPTPVFAAEPSIVVLGLRSVEGDDEVANGMTEALRAAVKGGSSWRFVERAVSMSQMVLVHGCDDVDVACLTNISRGLNAERVLYGTVRRTAANASAPATKYNYEVTVSVFNATTFVVAGTETETIERAAGKKGLLPHAQALATRLAASEISFGRLAVEVNVLTAEVRVDGQVVGQTTERKLALDNLTPGDHVVEVAASGHQTHKQTIFVRAGELSEVGVMLERTQEAVAGDDPEAPSDALSPDAEPAVGGGSLRWLGYTLIGVGAASAIAWGASMYMIEFQYNQDDTYQRYKNAYQNRTLDACTAAISGDDAGGALRPSELSDFQSRCRTGRTFQTLQWVFLGAAVVAAGSGVYVLISESGKSDTTQAKLTPPRFTLTPQVERRSLALQATLRF